MGLGKAWARACLVQLLRGEQDFFTVIMLDLRNTMTAESSALRTASPRRCACEGQLAPASMPNAAPAAHQAARSTVRAHAGAQGIVT